MRPNNNRNRFQTSNSLKNFHHFIKKKWIKKREELFIIIEISRNPNFYDNIKLPNKTKPLQRVCYVLDSNNLSSQPDYNKYSIEIRFLRSSNPSTKRK